MGTETLPAPALPDYSIKVMHKPDISLDTFGGRSAELRVPGIKRKRGDELISHNKHMTRNACSTDPHVLRDFFNYSSIATTSITKTTKRSPERSPEDVGMSRRSTYMEAKVFEESKKHKKTLRVPHELLKPNTSVHTLRGRPAEPRAAANAERKRRVELNSNSKHMTRKACSTDPEISRDFVKHISIATSHLNRTRKGSPDANCMMLSQGEQEMGSFRIHDHMDRAVNVPIGPAGGTVQLHHMGIKIILPPGAVDHDMTLRVSIKEPFQNPTEDQDNWGIITPLIEIEPHDVIYHKPVYFIVNHNLRISQGSLDRPLMLHRDNKSDAWMFVPTSDGSMDEAEKYGFPVCPNKKVTFTDTQLILEMRSNCLVAAFYKIRDPQYGIDVRVYRMSVLVYADYQPNAQALNIRAHIAHGTQDRIDLVHQAERSRYRGHFLGETAVLIQEDPRDPVTVMLSITPVTPEQAPPLDFQETLDANLTKIELGHRTGQPPHVSFIARFPSTVQSSVEVVVTAKSGQLATSDNMRIIRDLNQLTLTPAHEVHDAHPEYPSSGPSVTVSHAAQCHDRMIEVLKQHLTDQEMEKVKRSLNCDTSDDTDMILNIFVDSSGPRVIIEKLRYINALGGDVERGLRDLVNI